MQTLGPDHGQAGIGIAQDENGVRFQFHHGLIARRNDIPHRFAQIRAYGVQIQFGVLEPQIVEKDAVQGVIVILPRMDEDRVQVFPALFDHGR